MKKKILLLCLLLFRTLVSNAQTVSDNLSWVSGSSVTSALSPSFNFCNGQVTYTFASSIGFSNISTSGNPNYTTGLITPSFIFDPSLSIPMSLTFSQPVCNLRIQFTDLDGGQNEYLSAISTPYSGLTDVTGHLSNPGNSTQVNSNMDNARGWVEWSGPITNLTFNYNRPGPGCGLIIDSIIFECCSNPCQNPPNPGTNNTLSICAQGASADLFPLLGPGASVNGAWTNPVGMAISMPYNPLTMNPGAYTYTVDSSGCISSAIITVTEINTTVAAVTTDATCPGISNGSATLTVTNATQYSLNGGPNTPIPTPFVINGLAAGAYQVVVSNGTGCADTENFIINEPLISLPLITSISPDLVACSGDVSTVTATGSGGSLPYTFTWFTNSGVVGTGTTINVTPNQTTQYGVILTEACGSIPDTAFVTIVVPQPLNPILTPDDTVGCFPHHVIFSNNTAGPGNVVTSTINFGDGTPTITTNALDTCSHTYESSGSYTVSITSVSDSGCVYSSTFTNMIEVYGPTADFTISPNPTTIFETNVVLNDNSSTDVVNYSWLIEEGTPATSSSENVNVDFPAGIVGNYNVTLIVTNANGCMDSVTKIVQVLTDVILYAPNTFTPDGDEFNQNWFLYIDGIDIQQFNLQIFNRWGEVIWESNDPKGSWDGTYHGKIVPFGEYTWTLETRELVSDKKYRFNGHINVIR
ncbi:PKD domain-containing protein [Fluviicola sp.]|uniref:PKD domain-containing protein n=1 Tax=Fluviicola sp. TaxID=1917219 RepID=UPI003D2C11D4